MRDNFYHLIHYLYYLSNNLYRLSQYFCHLRQFMSLESINSKFEGFKGHFEIWGDNLQARKNFEGILIIKPIVFTVFIEKLLILSLLSGCYC